MKSFIVRIGLYYLAILCWLFNIVMYATIIFIPVMHYLREESYWLEAPFYHAYNVWCAWDDKYRYKKRIEKENKNEQ